MIPMDTDKEAMLINATRYCLGRQSYAVGEHCDILRRSWPYLRRSVREVIEADVERALTSGQVGMDQDRREWERVAALWRGQ